VCVCVCMISW